MRRLLKIFFILTLFSQFPLIVSAQAYVDKKITIVARNNTLKEVFTKISSQSGVYFSYSTKNVDDKSRITLIARKQPVEEIVKQICIEKKLKYVIVEKQIILKPKKNVVTDKNPVIPTTQNIKKYTVSGFVKDSASKEVLIGAIVNLNKQKIAISTNAYGFFSFSLPKGYYSMQFSFIGYKKKTVNFNITNSNLNFPVMLNLRTHELKIITVNEEDNVSLLYSSPLKKFKINQNNFSAKSFLGGESDAIKNLSSVPGVSIFGEGSVIFNVRGGNKGQNAVLIDDAPVYNPSHLLGFFSTIAPEAINSMNIYKSNFPISMGQRLSSFVDIRTKEGNMSKLGFGGNFSPILSTFTLDGPIKKDKISFYTTFRKSNINYLFNKNTDNLDILFYDFHFKINYKPSRKDRLFFSIYRGYDNIKFQNSAIRWRNNTMTFRWNHLFSDKLFSNTTMYSSLYRYFFYYSIENNIFWSSDIANISLKQDYTYYKSSRNKIYFGFETKLNSFNPGNLTYGNYYLQKVFAGNVWSNSLYFGGEFKPNYKLSLNYGIQFANWNNFGPTQVYSFNSEHRIKDTLSFGNEIYNTYNRFSPKISLHWLINSSSTISFAYDHNVQFLNHLSNSISPFTTINFWIPANIFIEPQTANQFTIGFFKKFPQIDISLELYAKKMNNQIDYSNQPNLFLNSFFESQLRFGETYSAGIEMSIKKQKGDFKFIISYSFSRTIRKTPDVNFNNPYSALWDKPHNFYSNFSYNFSDRFSVNTSFIYFSGNKFSSPTGYYNYMNYSVPIYEQKNNDKLPDYHRMDLAFKWKLNKMPDNRYVHFFMFSIYNVYSHQNIIGINFNKIKIQTNSFVVPSNYVSENELVPTSMYLLGFVPSISYKFNFR